MPTTREEALQAVNRGGIVSQSGSGEAGPMFYGRIVEVHSSGDYLKFSRGSSFRDRWYHRRDVHLHPLKTEAA